MINHNTISLLRIPLVSCIIFSILFLSYFHIKAASFTSILFGITLMYLLLFERKKFIIKIVSTPVIYFVILTLPLVIFSIVSDFSNIYLASKLLLMPLVVIITFSILIKHIIEFEKIKKILTIFLSIDAIIAIFQFFEFDFAWKIRALLQTFSSDNDARVMHAINTHEHPLGLAYQSITFSYHMILFFALTFSNWIEDKKNINYQIYFIIASIGLFMSFSMSAIGGVFISYVLFIYRRNLIPNKILIINFLLAGLLILLALLIKREFNFVSAHSRIFHLYAGINVFIDNYIFGLQGNEYTTLARPYLDRFSYVPSYVYNEAVHNSYLMAMLKLGCLSIFLIFFLFYSILKLCQVVEFISSKGCYMYSLYFPAYFTTSFFHNAGPYTGDQLFWVVVGFLVISVSFDTDYHNEE